MKRKSKVRLDRATKDHIANELIKAPRGSKEELKELFAKQYNVAASSMNRWVKEYEDRGSKPKPTKLKPKTKPVLANKEITIPKISSGDIRMVIGNIVELTIKRIG